MGTPEIWERLLGLEKNACGSYGGSKKAWISQKRVFWWEKKSACGSYGGSEKAFLDTRDRFLDTRGGFLDTRGRFLDTKPRVLGLQVQETRKKLVFCT